MFVPKVSIIVPVYNLESYIGNTLRSLLTQTYQNIEIVLVDDGSNDSSLSIIQDFASQDSRIIYTSQSNGGAAKARNTGLSLATGEFITFVDGDDMLSPTAISDNISYFTDIKIDWVAFSIRRVDVYGNYIQPKKGVYSDFIISTQEDISFESFVPYFYSRKLSGVACGAIYRKSSISTIQFLDGMYYEDSIFFIDLLCNTNHALLSDKGEYLYLDRENSSQKAILDYAHFESLLYVARKRLKQYRLNYPIYESYYIEDESNFYYFLKNEYSKGNETALLFLMAFVKETQISIKKNYLIELKCFIYRVLGYKHIKRFLVKLSLS